ncbi:MAG: hypothetical protein WBX11_18815 [Thiobacillaceae bacterium]
MNYQLKPDHLQKTRQAILVRMKTLGLEPEGIVNVSQFAETLAQFSASYYHAAVRQLAKEKVIDLLSPEGRYYQLTQKGYLVVDAGHESLHDQ